MTTTQLLKLLITNRELIQRNNLHAVEHLQMLKEDYGHINDEEVLLSIELNNSLIEKQFHSNHAKAIENSLQVINAHKQTTHQYFIARHYWLVGHSYIQLGSHDKAEYYLRQSQLINITDEQADTVIKTDALIALGMNEEIRCGGIGSPKAVAYLEEALEKLQTDNYIIRKASCLMGLGNVLLNSGNAEASLEKYLAAAAIYESFFDLANMASVYSNIGSSYFQLKNYEKAELYIEKSLELRIKLGSPDDLSISYYNLAAVHKDTGRLQSSYDLLVKSLEISQKTGNIPHLKKTELVLEEVCVRLGTSLVAA